MADEGADNLSNGDDASFSTGKKSGLKGVFPSILKYILIGVAAIILIVTIVVVVVTIMNKGGSKQTSIPVSEEYNVKRESYDWYTSLDQIRTSTSDSIPASVSVTIVLGYKKDDKSASTEITERRIEIIDFLRRYFAEKTVEELRPQNEDLIRIQIRDQINDDILTNS